MRQQIANHHRTIAGSLTISVMGARRPITSTMLNQSAENTGKCPYNNPHARTKTSAHALSAVSGVLVLKQRASRHHHDADAPPKLMRQPIRKFLQLLDAIFRRVLASSHLVTLQ